MDKKITQSSILLNEKDMLILDELVEKFRGTRSQIFRLALIKFYEENGVKI